MYVENSQERNNQISEEVKWPLLHYASLTKSVFVNSSLLAEMFTSLKFAQGKNALTSHALFAILKDADTTPISDIANLEKNVHTSTIL